MSQGHKSFPHPPCFPPPPSSSTHGGRGAVPTQLRRALGRQQVPGGLSCPAWGSGEATGRQRGSVGQKADLGLRCHTPAPLWAQGWGGPMGSPRSPPGSGALAGIGTRFSCSVPTKPLQKSGGSARSRATTWARRDRARGCRRHPGQHWHLGSPPPHLALARRVLHDGERRGVGRAVPHQRGAEDAGQVEDVHLAVGAARHPARGRQGERAAGPSDPIARRSRRHRVQGGGRRAPRAPHLSRCSMRKASVSLLAGGSLPTTCRRAVPQAVSSGMSAAAPGALEEDRPQTPPRAPARPPAHRRPAGRPGAGRR